MANINEIISQISDAGGVARPTLFSVQIQPPRIFSSENKRQSNDDLLNLVQNTGFHMGEPIQNVGGRIDYFKELGVEPSEMYFRLNLFCQHAELPSASFSTSDNRTYGSYYKIPYVDTYSDISLDFIVGRDMAERDFFDAWRYTIQDPETADFNYVDEFSTTIDIYQMDEYDQATYGVRLFQTWPVSVGSLQLAYESRNAYHILPVTFTYRKWINLKLDTNTPESIRSAGGTPVAFEKTISKSKTQSKSECET